jgi:hypothetical protein
MTVTQLLPVADLPGFVKPGVDVTKLLADLPGFDKVPLSKFGWMNTLSGTLRPFDKSPVSMVILNNKLWYTDGVTVFGVDPVDGTVLVSLNIQTYLGDTSAGVTIEASDFNGLLYLAITYGDSATGKSQLVRVDTLSGTIKDGFYPRPTGTDPILADLYGINAIDYVWALHGAQILKFDTTSGAVVQTYGKPNTFPSNMTFDPQGLLWDPANQLLWVKCLDNGTSNSLGSTVYVCSIDANNNLITQASFHLFNVWEYATLAASTAETIYDSPDGREVAILDNDWQGTKQFYINRYNAATGALIASQSLGVVPGLDGAANIVNISAPLKYNPITDEYFVQLTHGATQQPLNTTDLWAFKRKDFTQNRIVGSHTASQGMFDYCFDAAGNVFVMEADLTNNQASTIVGQLR